jgi:hypothetical protein
MKVARVVDSQASRARWAAFRRYIRRAEPALLRFLKALEDTGTLGEAARRLRMPPDKFTRERNRLHQHAEYFDHGTPVPPRRAPYKKRNLRKRRRK